MKSYFDAGAPIQAIATALERAVLSGGCWVGGFLGTHRNKFALNREIRGLFALRVGLQMSKQQKFVLT